MSTLEKEKKVNLDAGLDPNYTELDPDYTDDMGEYELIEISNSTIRALVGYCGRERFLEKEKESPNQERIVRLNKLSKELHADEKSVDFSSAEDMRNIIKKYMPLLRKVNYGGRLA